MTDPDGPPGYPTRWEVDAVLSDGGTVHVRPVRPDDRGRLDRFHRRQSPESIYFRFFGPHPRLSERELDHFTIIDYRDRMALVCLLGDDIVGVGRYEQYSPGTAEVAFFIDDEHHGRGMATLLLEYLMVAAREVGYGAVIATVMPTNQAMLRVFHKAGFQVRSGFSDGVVEVRFDIEPTAETEAAIADRARRAAARSVARLLRPQSIAVIGAGREAGGLGHELFARLIAGWFDGPVYPVNRDADVVRSVRAHRRLVDVADPVDLAFVAVPPEALDEVLDDCGRKGVGALVVLTADVDGEALAVRARRAGMRLVGPASLGVLNHAPDVRMRAIPAGRVPRRGRIALAAASAALGAVVLGEAAERDIGLSSFVSLGGKSDIDTSDLLQFWAEDADTAAIALYLESIPRPRRFFAVARSVSRSKPIVAISMVDDTPGPLGPRWSVFSALLAQAGVIEVASLSQLFDTTRLLASQPLPAGRRLAIVANAHGAATLAAAAARRERLEPEMSTIADDGSVRVQTGDGADTAPATSQAPAAAMVAAYGPALRQALAGADAAVVIAVPPVLGEAFDVSGIVADVAAAVGKPALLVTGAGVAADRRVPAYHLPENAVRALARVCDHADRTRHEAGPAAHPQGFDVDRVRSVAARVLAQPAPDGTERGVRTASLDDVVALLDAAGVSVVAQRWAAGADEAVAAGDALGFPVAVKARVRRPNARTAAGGLVLDVGDAAALRAAHARMLEALGPDDAGTVLVQAMAPPGVDVQVLALDVDQLGPVVAVGRGGSGGDRPDDLAVHLAPLGHGQALRLLRRTPLAGLLGEGALDPLAELLERVGCLLDEVPQVVELRLDPVLATAEGAIAVDVLARLRPQADDERPEVRGLV